MKTFLAAALMSAAVIAGPAYAQTAQPAAPAATTTPAAGKMMLKGNWRASKLMGSTSTTKPTKNSATSTN